MLFRLAYRNIRSNQRRSILSILAIAVGLAVLIFSGSLRTGQYSKMINSGTSQLAGHVVIQHLGYQESKNVGLLVEDVTKIREQWLQSHPNSQVTIRTFLGGLINSGNRPNLISLTGIHPTAEESISSLPSMITKGHWVQKPIDIVLGRHAVEMLDVSLGDKLVFTAAINGEMQSHLFRLSGVFDTGSQEFDAFVGFVHYQALSQMFNQEDVAHQLALHLTSYTNAQSATQSSKNLFSNQHSNQQLEILSWKEAMPDILHMIMVDKVANALVNAILLTIVALGIVNTMMMSVLERLKQFGVLLSLGTRMVFLLRLILCEGFLLGVLGAIVGIILGLVVTYPAVQYGIDFSGKIGENVQVGNMVNATVLYAEYNVRLILQDALIALFFAVMATMYPAWKLSKMEPIQALRHY